jgi:hypothetical protein
MDDKYSSIVSAVIEVTADKIGEMLVETAEGIREHSYEEIARQALLACFNTLIDEGPTENQINTVSAAIYRQLHDQETAKWADLPEIEKSFWADIARAAITAGDIDLIGELQQT